MKREITFDEVYDAQAYYRLLLDSMARPGKLNKLPEIGVLPPTGFHKASALIALTLLNSDVTFHVDSVNSRQVSSYLTLNTSSTPVESEQADYIFIPGDSDGHVLADVQVGTLSYPEQGATCVVDVTSIDTAYINNSIKMTLRGPGVEQECIVYVSGLSAGILKNLMAQNQEFPLGIDLILVDIDNTIICIPRSNRFSWEVSSNE